jgi:hypothetical protein
MIEVDVCLYIASHARVARLQKLLGFVVLPRLGEFVKIRNREQGDYFAFTVAQVTHKEGGPPELWLELTTAVGDRSMVDLFEDSELDEYVASYLREGWTLASVVPNRMQLGNPNSSGSPDPKTVIGDV